jgi:hypothetical protein
MYYNCCNLAIPCVNLQCVSACVTRRYAFVTLVRLADSTMEQALRHESKGNIFNISRTKSKMVQLTVFFFVWTPRQFAPMIISVHLLFIVWIIYIQPFGNRYQWSVMSQLQSVILTTVLPSLLVFISGDRGGRGCPIKGVFPFLAIVCVTCMSLQAFRVR